MDSFHWCALAAGSIAKTEGRFEDSEYVRRLAYAMFEAAKKIQDEKKQCARKSSEIAA